MSGQGVKAMIWPATAIINGTTVQTTRILTLSDGKTTVELGVEEIELTARETLPEEVYNMRENTEASNTLTWDLRDAEHVQIVAPNNTRSPEYTIENGTTYATAYDNNSGMLTTAVWR